MAAPRFAICRAVDVISDDTRVLHFQPDDGLPVDFVGGQFLIADTGLLAASGKAIKRAYSFASADHTQTEFSLAVKRLPGGLGSQHMHGFSVGDRLKWSGPWGKLVPGRGAEAAGEVDGPDTATVATGGRTLVLATDTGITAALGLVSGQRFAAWAPHTRFVWLRTDARYFVPDEWVRARVPAGLSIEIAALPPPGHPERLGHVRAVLGADLLPGHLARAFITGDGDVNYALLDQLVGNGLPITRDDVDSFFNFPKKVAAA